MEKVICYSKMQLSVWCTQATWTTAPSSEMGFIAMQKLSSIAHILVGLQANIFSDIKRNVSFIHDNVNVYIFVFCFLFFLTTEILEFCHQDVCSIF